MDDSVFYVRLVRNLYYFRNKSISILKSRTYTLANNVKLAIKAPLRFAKKGAVLFVKDPKKLLQIALGKRVVQDAIDWQEKLTQEYNIWIKEAEIKPKKTHQQYKEVKGLKKTPLISLITPVFNPPTDAHIKLIDSVLAQSYPNFQLLLFNFGNKPEIRKLLDGYAQKEPRIVVMHDLANKGISENSNLCLQYADGEYVGLLDHDDALTEDALFECVKAINEDDYDFIYTDKDKITEDDVRMEPLFKPDWSPEMALAGNYMTHFNLMRTSLVRKLGGWNPDTDGAQDWDLFLRIIQQTHKIKHVPKIVYHWRTVAGSTATEVSVKPYAIKAQQTAVNKHLKYLGINNATAKHDTYTQQYVNWEDSKEPITFIIHCLHHDIGNIAKIADFIVSDRLFHKDSSIFVISLTDDLTDGHDDILSKIEFPIKFVEYESGELSKTLLSIAKTADNKKIIYLADCIKEISSDAENGSWVRQLSGWLELPSVAIAGGGIYSENGQVIDVGSFFDSMSKSFCKYLFSTGLRSGYNGYIQWTRNFILPSEHVTAFKTELLSSTVSNLQGIRDDELIKSMALYNYSVKERAVYDPKVTAISGASFDISLGNSTSLNKFINTSCRFLIENGDPFYNPNLDNNYSDPKPVYSNNKPKEISPYRVTSLEVN